MATLPPQRLPAPRAPRRLAAEATQKWKSSCEPPGSRAPNSEEKKRRFRSKSQLQSPAGPSQHYSQRSLRCAFVSNFSQWKPLLSSSTSSFSPPSPLFFLLPLLHLPCPQIPKFPPKWRLTELQM